jgi:hypothetical protein
MPDAASTRKDLYALLGDLPPRGRPIAAKTIHAEERPLYTLETLVLDLNGFEPTTATFVRPKCKAPFPAVVFNHSHGGEYGIGRREFTEGRAYMQPEPWADTLARLGIAGLAIDHWCFGSRAGRTESATFKEHLWHGRVLWGLMVYDTLRATDYLLDRPDVDASRIATLGMSMGSTMAWWHAALDDRILLCVDICCLTDFQSLIEAGGLDGHGIYYYVPGLLKRFSTADINTLICPRPHLSLAGNLDGLTPAPGLDRVDAALRRVYVSAGVPDRWKMLRQDVGHVETPGMRAEAVRWLERWLVRSDGR